MHALPGHIPVITTPETVLETLKNRFLAAIYDSGTALLPVYKEILERARIQALSETDEKHLRQVQAAFKRFKSDLSGRDTTGTLNTCHVKIQHMLRDRARQLHPSYQGYPAWEKALNITDWQKQLLFRNAVTLQLTTGCSNYCRRCNEWALPGIRSHFNRRAVETFIRELAKQNNTDLALYGGSDPLDWKDGSFTLADMLASLDMPCEFSLLTKVPKGKEREVKKMVRDGIPLAVSLTNRNRSRVNALEACMETTLTKQHATPDLLIPACLDEDFVTVKPSITDSYGTEISLDGAYIIIPTFTSALYPFGHKKIPVTRSTRFFPAKKLGRPALLVDYFKPLEVRDKTNLTFHLEGLLDVQVENILLDNGDDDLTPPGMRSVKEYFEIFDDAARQQRKKMTLSVMRRLKQNGLQGAAYATLGENEKRAYRDKIQAHLEFTRKAPVMAARVSAAAYFLAAIRTYLASGTPKHAIISRLTRNEYQELNDRKPEGFENTCLQDLFSDPGQSAWSAFRTLALSLVHCEKCRNVDEFIADWPVTYHPETDRFLRQPSRPLGSGDA